MRKRLMSAGQATANGNVVNVSRSSYRKQMGMWLMSAGQATAKKDEVVFK